MFNILVSIITLGNPKWREQIEEIDQLGIKECSLFVSALEQSERAECYRRLEQIKDLQIPFIHARHDMKESEYRYLMQRFGTKLFNLHTLADFPPEEDISSLRDVILTENSGPRFIEEDVQFFGGICLDLSHLESDRLTNNPRYDSAVVLVEKYGVKANHIGGKLDKPTINRLNVPTYDRHEIDDVSNLDYVKNYPTNYFGQYIALELHNPIKEQLEAAKYLREWLNEK